MKFFLEFVSCCGSPSSSRQSAPKTPPLPAEETRSLVPPRRCRRRKRGKLGVLGSVETEWRPSLCVISEDNVVAEKDERTVGSERTVKRKAQVHGRSHSADYGRTPYPMVIPAFSPTPFLF